MLFFNSQENIDSSNGIFAYCRKNRINVSITSPGYYNSPEGSYCGEIHTSKPVSCIIDGTNSTAWRNNDKNKSYFIIDFESSLFYLTSYTIVNSFCSMNNNTLFPWKLYGSIDYENWDVIFESKKALSGSFFTNFKVERRRSYRYFNFSASSGWIHLTQIEFFGILNRAFPTCQSNNIYSILHVFYFAISFTK